MTTDGNSGIRCSVCGSPTHVSRSSGAHGGVKRERRCKNSECKTRMQTSEIVVQIRSMELVASAPIADETCQ